MLTIGVTCRNVMVYTCSRSYLLHGNKLIDVQLGLRVTDLEDSAYMDERRKMTVAT